MRPRRLSLLSSAMELFGITVRWLWMAGAASLVGVFASLVLVVRPAARAAGPIGEEQLPELDARLCRLGGTALVVTLAAGVLDLWRQVTIATGADLGESLD